MKLNKFASKVRERKPEYAHLDDTDLIQMVAEKKPDLLKNVDRDDLAQTMRESRKKKISQERQKAFKSLSGISRFGIGAGQGVVDTFMGIKQALSSLEAKGTYGGEEPVYYGEAPDFSEYEKEKKEYMETTEGDVLAGLGEVGGAIAATAPVPGVTGAKLASKFARPAMKLLSGLVAGGTVGGLMGAGEFVDEDETRAKNTLYGTLFGAGGMAAAKLAKKVGAKTYNAIKERMKTANLQELWDLSKKYDIPLSIGDFTKEGRMTEKALEQAPVVGMGGFRREGAEKVQEAIRKEASKVGADWDETIQKSLKSKASFGKSRAKKLYDRVDELSGNTRIKSTNAMEKAKFHSNELESNIVEGSQNPFGGIVENLGESKTFKQLRKAREDLGNAAQTAENAGDRDLARRLKDVKKGIEFDIDDLVKDKSDNIEQVADIREKVLGQFLEEQERLGKIEKFESTLEGFGQNRSTIQKMANYVKLNGNKKNKGSNLLVREHIPKERFGMASDDMARELGMDESDFMQLLDDLPTKGPKIGKGGFPADWDDLPDTDVKPDKEVLKAYKEARTQYRREVIPYTQSEIVKAMKSETPDELFNKFFKKGKGDRAKNFYNLLDDKGKGAVRDGFIDNAIQGATTDGTTSPAKLAGYLERMSKPAESIFKGKDLQDIKGLAKIMRHAERYGQINESPSNGMQLISYIKTGGLGGIGYGLAKSPVATTIGVMSAGALTKLASLWKTKGARLALADDKIGSEEFENALNKIIGQLPKVSAQTQKTIGGQSLNMPKEGDEIEGYRFMGGDPADEKSWELK